MEKPISKQTPVTVGLLIVVAGVVWKLANISFATAENSRNVEELWKRQAAVEIIKTDIAVIRSKLEEIEKHQREYFR